MVLNCKSWINNVYKCLVNERYLVNRINIDFCCKILRDVIGLIVFNK